MASIASLRATPKVEQAATGAKASPVMRPSIVIWEAEGVVDVPEQVGRHRLPGRRRGAPGRLELRLAPALLLEHAQLAALDLALDGERLDVGELGEELVRPGAPRGPVPPPGPLGVLAILLGRRRGIRRRLAVRRRPPGSPRASGERGVPLGPPEAVPAALGAVEHQRLAGDHADAADPRADVDVGVDPNPVSSCSRPGFWPRAWMKAATAKRVGSIFSTSWRKRLGGKRCSIQGR